MNLPQIAFNGPLVILIGRCLINIFYTNLYTTTIQLKLFVQFFDEGQIVFW